MIGSSPRIGVPGGRTALLLPLMGLLSGCDVPTELPRWDTRWVIPADRTAFAVEDLLPAGVAVTPDGDGLTLRLSDISFARTLGEICTACAAANGLTVPKPAFTVSFGDDLPLPGALLSATLVEGALQVRLQHDFPFDPLRPSGTARGYLVLTARSGAELLARDSISGSRTALPPGSVLTRTLELQPGTVAEDIEIGLTLHSPAGDPVRIDVSDRLSVAVTASDVRVSDVRVLVADRAIVTPPIHLDVEGVDEAVAGRVRSGAVLLEVENPFEIAGSFELRITTASTEIVKPLDLVPGFSTHRLELTGDDVRAILGQEDVQVVMSGVASSPPEGTAVNPDDEIGLRPRLELVISSTEDR